ncbi:MAG: cell division protein ZapA [Gemmatimonadaceae bacterium]
MTTKKTSVRVTILGEEYTLRSAASPEETQAVARYVDQQIREIMQAGLVIESNKAAILACLRLAGELFQARTSAKRVEQEMTALGEEIRPWLPPAKRYD